MFIRRLRQLFLLTGDLALLYLGLAIALSIRSGALVSMNTYERHIPLFSIVFLVAIVSNYIFGLYEGFGIKQRNIQSYLSILSSATIVFFGATFFFYILPNPNISPKTILILTVLIGYIGSILHRLIIQLLFGWKDIHTRIGIIGNSEQSEIVELTERLQAHPDYSLAWVSPTPHTTDLQQAHKIVLSPDSLSHAETKKQLYTHAVGSTGIISLYDFYESITGKVATAACDDEWFISNIDAPAASYTPIRNIIDYLFGIVLGLCTIVLFIPIALLITCTSRGPILFRQTRVGKGGKAFTLYKFRTMYALSADGSAEIDGAVFSKKGDARITPIGRFLRKTRLDELPQSINIIKRDLSIIGPRPERPEIIARLEDDAPYFSTRTLIKPGITGWAAVKQHYTDSTASTIEKLQYDLFYIKHQSLWLDMKILLLTIRTVLHMRGQ